MKVAGVVGEGSKLAAEYALGEGAEVATTAALSGEAATLGAGAAFGAGAAVAGGVLAAGAFGYEAGNLIEEHTHVGEHAGDFLYEHSDPQDALNAAHHFDDAGEDWDKGNYGSAIADGVEGVGSMVEGVWDAL